MAARPRRAVRTGVTYVDSSAFMKLVVAEPESAALRRYLAGGHHVASALLRTEVLRASMRVSQAHLADARQLLREIDLIDVHRQLLERAGELQPPEIRSLDAIHLATALDVGGDLRELVTYDGRMAEAAHQWGLAVVAPA